MVKFFIFNYQYKLFTEAAAMVDGCISISMHVVIACHAEVFATCCPRKALHQIACHAV